MPNEVTPDPSSPVKEQISREAMNPNSEAIYDAEIAPLMKQIIEICKANKIPMLASFQYYLGDDELGPGFCTTRIPFEGECKTLAAATVELKREAMCYAFTITKEKS